MPECTLARKRCNGTFSQRQVHVVSVKSVKFDFSFLYETHIKLWKCHSFSPKNALIGREEFEVKRIQVYEMEKTEEMKQKKEEHLKRMEEERKQKVEAGKNKMKEISETYLKNKPIEIIFHFSESIGIFIIPLII